MLTALIQLIVSHFSHNLTGLTLQMDSDHMLSVIIVQGARLPAIIRILIVLYP